MEIISVNMLESQVKVIPRQASTNYNKKSAAVDLRSAGRSKIMW